MSPSSPSMRRLGAGIFLWGTLTGLACGLVGFLVLFLMSYLQGNPSTNSPDNTFIALLAFASSALIGLVLGAVLSTVALLIHLLLRQTRLSRTAQGGALFATLVAGSIPAWLLLEALLFEGGSLSYVLLVFIVPAAIIGAWVVTRYIHGQYVKAEQSPAIAPKKPTLPCPDSSTPDLGLPKHSNNSHVHTN